MSQLKSSSRVLVWACGKVSSLQDNAVRDEKDSFVFGISGTELMIILFFGFLIFGPEKLPQMGRTVGRAIRQFKDASEAANKKFKEQVADPFQEAIAPYKDQMDESTKPIQEDIAAINSTLNETKSMFTDPFKDILSPSSAQMKAAEKTGAVIATGVADDDPFAEPSGDVSTASSDEPTAQNDDSNAPHPERSTEGAESKDFGVSAGPAEAKPLPDNHGTVKKSMAASLYDLDEEDGE